MKGKKPGLWRWGRGFPVSRDLKDIALLVPCLGWLLWSMYT